MSYSASERSSRTPSVVTPSSSELTTIGNLRLQDDPSDAVPWPGNEYKIIETTTGKLLVIEGGALQIMDAGYTSASDVTWLCVEANGYFGLFHLGSNMYLSVNGPGRSLSGTFGPDQYFFPRRHPKGGYQLLSPAGSNTLNQLAVLLPYLTTFVKRQHAGTIWRFVRVSTGDEQAAAY